MYLSTRIKSTSVEYVHKRERLISISLGLSSCSSCTFLRNPALFHTKVQGCKAGSRADFKANPVLPVLFIVNPYIIDIYKKIRGKKYRKYSPIAQGQQPLRLGALNFCLYFLYFLYFLYLISRDKFI